MKKMKSKGQIAAFFLAIIMFIGIWGIPTFAAADSKAEAFKQSRGATISGCQAPKFLS